MMQQILFSRKTELGIEVFVRAPDGGDTICSFDSMIGGLSWPAGRFPGYFCICGVQRDPSRAHAPGQDHSLRLLAEQQTGFLDDLCSRVTETARLLNCDYLATAEQNDQTGAFHQGFATYVRRQAIHRVRLVVAPFAGNVEFGLYLARDMGKAKRLDIPAPSILHTQMSTFRLEDIGADTEKNFYALNALRYVLGFFYMHRGRKTPKREVVACPHARGWY